MMPVVTRVCGIDGGSAGERRESVPILMYHDVSPHAPRSFGKYTVSPRDFAGQMGVLAWAGYTPIGLDALVASRTDGAGLPEKPIVITFDDGFASCVEHAVPVLQRHGFTAVFFLVAGLMGGCSEWLRRERGLAIPMMSWSTARVLLEAGFTFGAHTVSHPRLATLSDRATRHELRASRAAIEDRLATRVSHLAYPFGSYDERVREITRELGFRSACSVRIGLSRADDDLFALHRVPVSGTDSLVDFAARLRTGRSAREVLAGARHRMRAQLHRWTGTSRTPARARPELRMEELAP
jgi:peptidoglycan/xylan/chitin deacetylase (PgdA/CDA1 family)